MMMTGSEEFNVDSPELLRELERVKAGVLTAFVESEGAAMKVGGIVREIAMSLGMRFGCEILVTDYRPLQWSLGVRCVSALAPNFPKFALVRFCDVYNPLEIGRFLRSKLFNVIDESDSLVEFYAPESRIDFEARSIRESRRRVSRKIVEEDNEFIAELPTPAPLIGCDYDWSESLDNASSVESIVRIDEELTDSQLDQEKKRWVDALSALIVQYMTRFHEAPPMSLIEESVRGKILLTASRKSPLTVSGDMKIYLPELNEIQLRMTPLATTVYILFLCHPEGIRLKDIGDYRSQLAEIYSMVKPGASEAMAEASIDELVNPMSNSLNEKLSMIRRSINRYILDKYMAQNYIVTGTRGEPYRIALDAELIRLPESLKSIRNCLNL